MKSMDFYKKVSCIYEAIFIEYDLLSIVEELGKKSTALYSNQISYEDYSNYLELYYAANEGIEIELNKLQSKYSDSIVESSGVRKITGKVVVKSVKQTVQRNGLVGAAAKLLNIFNDLEMEMKNLQYSYLMILNAMRDIRNIQYKDFKEKYNDDVVLELKVSKEFLTFREFQELIDKCDKILKSFKRVVYEDSPEENHIYSIDDGSFILAVGTGIVVAKLILDCIKTFYDIRLQKEKYEQEVERNSTLKLLSEELKTEIKKQMCKEIDFEDITEKLIMEWFNENSSENKNELKNLLVRSIKDLHYIIDQGGEINLLEESKKEIEQNKEGNSIKEDLRRKVKEIDNIQKNITSLRQQESIKAFQKNDYI